MPFWKKGEDPWDLQPEAGAKPRMTSAQDTPTLFEELRDWNEARRERKTQRETPPPATACPWCGQDMETDWIAGGRDGIQWWSGWPPRSLVDETPIRVDHEGTLLRRYKVAFLCRSCRRMALEFPEAVLHPSWDIPSPQVEDAP